MFGSFSKFFSRNAHDSSSFFLDPSLLPKVQYVSMMLESENDMSAQAEALNMKYLSDEQLSELAKRCTSPNGRWRNKADFDRMLATTPLYGAASRSNNNTLYGANHISFATRKYLEKHGLLDAPTTSEQRGAGKGPNVRGNSEEQNSRKPSPENGGSYCVEGYNVSNTANALGADVQRLNASFPVHNEQRQVVTRTPEISQLVVAAQTLESETAPSPRQVDRRFDNASCSAQTPGTPQNILDIRRLKELPKLL